jgi:hypothetical protein
VSKRQHPRLKKLLQWRKRGGTGCRCPWCLALDRKADAEGYRYFSRESTNWANAALPAFNEAVERRA